MALFWRPPLVFPVLSRSLAANLTGLLQLLQPPWTLLHPPPPSSPRWHHLVPEESCNRRDRASLFAINIWHHILFFLINSLTHLCFLVNYTLLQSKLRWTRKSQNTSWPLATSLCFYWTVEIYDHSQVTNTSTLTVLVGMFVIYHKNKSVMVQLGQLVMLVYAKVMRVKISICHTSGMTGDNKSEWNEVSSVLYVGHV